MTPASEPQTPEASLPSPPPPPPFTDVPSLCAEIGIADERDVLACFVLGSTGVAGSVLTAASDLDCVVVLKNDAKPGSRRWKNHTWLVKHGWLAWPLPSPSPSSLDDDDNVSPPSWFQRDYKGCDAYDCWTYTERTFLWLVQVAAAPFAVECLCLPPKAIWRNQLSNVASIWPDTRRLVTSFAAVSALHWKRASLEFANHQQQQHPSSPSSSLRQQQRTTNQQQQQQEL